MDLLKQQLSSQVESLKVKKEKKQRKKEFLQLEREWGAHVLMKAKPQEKVAKDVAQLIVEKQYVDPLCHALLYDR